jgi:mono/diheme cytochrome c family protein
MPNFGADHAATLAQLFTAADYHPSAEPITEDGRNTVGRELVGINGVTCIACHGVAGRKSLGVPAIDLAEAPKRLRREWFHAYLVDPAVLRPGTRMPSFWPGGLPANPKFGKGKKGTEHQIESIWVYLEQLDQSRLPEGLEEKGEYELKPSGEPIVFRTFMKKVGMQAIAVGFPEKLHVAFDAKDVRWALAWRGAFLNAEGTWEERAAPLAEPLSKDVAELATEPQFTTASDTKAGVRFGGYRLDARGVPTFLYRVGAVQIEDRVEPDATGRTLHRVLKLRGNGPLSFHPLSGEKIVSGSASPVVFDAQGNATIATEFTW